MISTWLVAACSRLWATYGTLQFWFKMWHCGIHTCQIFDGPRKTPANEMVESQFRWSVTMESDFINCNLNLWPKQPRIFIAQLRMIRWDDVSSGNNALVTFHDVLVGKLAPCQLHFKSISKWVSKCTIWSDSGSESLREFAGESRFHMMFFFWELKEGQPRNQKENFYDVGHVSGKPTQRNKLRNNVNPN